MSLCTGWIGMSLPGLKLRCLLLSTLALLSGCEGMQDAFDFDGLLISGYDSGGGSGYVFEEESSTLRVEIEEGEAGSAEEEGYTPIAGTDSLLVGANGSGATARFSLDGARSFGIGSIALSGTDTETVRTITTSKGTFDLTVPAYSSSMVFDLSTQEFARAITEFSLSGPSGPASTLVDDLALNEIFYDADSDGSFAFVPRPRAFLLPSADTAAEAVVIAEFDLSDGGTNDRASMKVSRMAFSFSSTQADASRLVFTLNGPGVSGVVGSLNSSRLIFQNLVIAVPHGGAQQFTLSARYDPAKTKFPSGSSWAVYNEPRGGGW